MDSEREKNLNCKQTIATDRSISFTHTPFPSNYFLFDVSLQSIDSCILYCKSNVFRLCFHSNSYWLTEEDASYFELSIYN